MQEFPEVVDLSVSPDALSGHLWLFESVTGLPLRVGMDPNGQLALGDERRRLDTPVPVAYRPAARELRTRFRRDALRSAVDDVTTVTVFGVGTCYRGVEYDWDDLPAFLVTHVYSERQDGLLAPDATVRSADRLGLTAAPVVEKELRADAFDPASVAFPASAWGEEPAAGLLAADKRGGRGRIDSDAVAMPRDPGYEDHGAAATDLLTAALLGRDVDRAIDALVRRNYGRLVAARIDPDDGEFHGAVARELNRRG